MKKHLGLVLNLIALGLFIPGILLPIFKMDMTMFANVMQTDITIPLVNQELSIMQTVQELYEDSRWLVAALIFLFSVCIPVFKTSAIIIAYLKRHSPLEQKILNFVSNIGKWSMADVFVVAIFLAVLSTNQAETATQHQLTLFNFQLPVTVASQTLSELGQGFYYFLAYCLLSLLGTHLSISTVNNCSD